MQMSDTGSRQVQRGDRGQLALTPERDRGREQSVLAVRPDLAQNDLPAVAIDLRVAEHRGYRGAVGARLWARHSRQPPQRLVLR